LSVLAVQGLSKEFRGNNTFTTRAIERLDFEVKEGEFLSIVGPSGCGKTTLLMITSGLSRPTSGKIMFKGREVSGPPEGLILLFQDYSHSLLPWRTVLKNVCYGLELKRQATPKEEILPRAREYLEAVGLSQFANHYPWQLSGGMQQRVAIARSLACQPSILLMDEPFASVDAQTRAQLEDTLLEIWEKFQQTILFVTHDIDESIYLSDRVLVLRHRPTVVLEDTAIGLPRPRNQLDTRNCEAFIRYRTRIHKMIIRRETGEAYEV